MSATSLTGALGARYPDSDVLCHDTFEHGPCGWEALVSSNVPTGVVGVCDYPASHGRALFIQSEDEPDTTTQPYYLFGEPCGIKRLGIVGERFVDVSLRWGWRADHGQNTPRAFEWGIDEANDAGNRAFPKFRWRNYDEAGAARSPQWQMGTGTLGAPTLTDVAAASIDHGYNENKGNLFYLRMIFDVQNLVYQGLQVNGTKFGSLLGLSDANNPLRAFGFPAGSLATFANGLNLVAAVRNRTNITATRATLYISDVKARAYS